MREYARLAPSFWTSEDIARLSDTAKLLAVYQLTSPHSNMAGVYRLTAGTVSDDLGWPSDRVSEGFTELHRSDFSTWCPRTKWLVIHKYLVWNPVRGPKQRQGLVKVVRTMPRGAAISERLFQVITQYVEELEPELMLAIKVHLDPKQDPHTLPLALGMAKGIERAPIEVVGAVVVAGTGVKAGEGASPPQPPVESDKPTARAARAYEEAYLSRYRVKPVMNAKARGQFSNLVARLGERAADVAAFYLTHNRKVYVDSKHCVDLLVRDAETIHTEFKQASTAGAAPDWWTTVRGVREYGKELGIPWDHERDTLATYTAKVFVKAGDGPHLKKVDALVMAHMQEIRSHQEAA